MSADSSKSADVSKSADESKKLNFNEQHYFSSYDHFGIHEEMLKDETRTNSYRNAIYQNRHLFKDKVVLDVGCGTGILSMFAAKSGARHVIGVDMSNIIHMAQKIVDINGFHDKITLLHGKLEEVKLPFDKVDIIISEWMGYFLLYESMLDTVLVARDMYLKEDGIIFPDKAIMYIAGIEDGEYKDEKIGFWNDVYGFDYSPFREVALADPLVDTVEMRAVATDPCKIFEIDLYTVKIEDLAFSSEFQLRARRNEIIHAFVVWFDIEFDKCHKVIKFSTGPHANYTHWKQTIFYLPEEPAIKDGEIIHGSIKSVPSDENPRNLDISIKYKLWPNEDISRRVSSEYKYQMK